MNATELARYQNGNCEVVLYSDGTKIREWPDGEEPAPEMPESVDLKITNWCDGECTWCSEDSTEGGRDASLSTISEMLKGANRGMEVALGGGDPMSHIGLYSHGWCLGDNTILEQLSLNGLVANLTVNAKHAERWAVRALALKQLGLLHGIGLSYHRGMVEEMKCLLTDDTVVHLIHGVHLPDDLAACFEAGFKKFLLLGYKDKRRARYNHLRRALDYCHAMQDWKESLPYMIPGEYLYTLSFDNLALEQLDVQSLVSPEVWQESFMGPDGRFTMYLDAVEDAFAASSNHPLRPREGRTLREMFAEVRRETS